MAHPIHPSIEQSSHWPYEWGSIPQSDMGNPGAAWKLGVSAGGSVVLWPGKDPFPNDLHLIPAYFHDSKEELEKIFPMLVLGYERDSRHKHQDGDVWLLPLSWRSYTLAQVGAVSRIVHAIVTNDKGWDVAKSWAADIQSGIDKLT